MFHAKSAWLNTLKPNFKVLPLKDRILCGVGALLGLGLSSFISWLALGDLNAWYIAPMGASSVLLFAVPASPLAQPWNMVVGNTLAALIGVTCAMFIPNLTEAFSIAVALAIVLMMTTDSLHPPSGAVAITAVLGGEAVHDLGYAFLFYPVLLNSVLLMVVAIIYNRLLGKQYPQKTQVNTRTADPTPTQKVSIQPADIQQVLEQQSQLLDISEYDLQKIILEAQQLASRRGTSQFSCRDIMSQQVIYLRAEDDIQSALDKFKQVNLMSLPVVSDLDRLVGNLALYDVVEWFKRAADPKASWENHVYQIMNPKVVTVQPDQPIQDLVPYFVERSFNYIPVVEQKKLVGMISRADMIAALSQQLNALQQYNH
ncbi:HPP family protein [Acinetobacter gandensis]|uniref:HPP family protein n=1 Tax=Acinetobacter gandensis TaxID=1443941 RepID=UPI003F56C4AA